MMAKHTVLLLDGEEQLQGICGVRRGGPGQSHSVPHIHPEAGSHEPLWDAIWVGVAKKSNEHVVVRDGGGPAIRCRSVKRRPFASRWSA